jgi:glycosyltransferase involved in cell wall biosynthesis
MSSLISIVVPAFNEADNLPVLVEEVARAMAGRDYELVIVDDGSTDGSDRVLGRLAAAEPRLRPFRMPGNRGQSAALAAGIHQARGATVVTLDADLQNDPADIPGLLDTLESCDVVSGVRTRRRDSLVRKLSSRIANAVRRRALHDGITDVGCSLKAYRREILEGLPRFNGWHRFLPALTQMRGARVREVAVHHRPRLHGSSSYGIGNRLGRGIADLLGVRWLQKRYVEPAEAAPLGAPPGEVQR